MQTLIDHRRIEDVPVLEFYNPQAGRKLPLIILMHGFTGRKEDLFQAGLTLARQGYYAVSIDLHLHGEAGETPFLPSPVAWRMDEVLERSCDSLDALLAFYAQDSASPASASHTGLLGVSLGGAVIYRFLSRRAQTGELPASGRAGSVLAASAFTAGLPHLWPETLRRARPLIPAFGVTDEMIQAAEAALRAAPPPPFLQGVRDFPLLMQYGQDDPLIPATEIRRAHQLALSGYTQRDLLQLVEHENCGHEAPPAMFARAFQWFAQHLQAPTVPDPIRKLRGANMDIDLATPAGEIAWSQDGCPWNAAEGSSAHRCAVKNISLCSYFRGVEYMDTLLCAYPQEK